MPAETVVDELSGASASEQRGESSMATGVSAAGEEQSGQVMEVSGQSLTADASAGSESGAEQSGHLCSASLNPRIVPGYRPPGMPEFMPPLEPVDAEKVQENLIVLGVRPPGMPEFMPEGWVVL